MVLGHRAPDYHGARFKFGHDGARAPGTRVPRARFKKDRARIPGARAPRARAIPGLIFEWVKLLMNISVLESIIFF